MIPIRIWIALGVLAALAAGVLGYGHWRYNAGQADTQDAWNASIERGRAEIAKLKADAGKITVRTETVTVEKVRTVHEKGKTIVRQVPVYIPADSCALPGGFRVLHDAAARNEPVPESTVVADEAPVPAATVATVVAENYAGCHANAAVIEGWQAWAREQCARNPPAEGCR
ncbi:MAG TPA: hypothetical protein VFH85_07830 [Gammaproteobacteria bacterium]|nr:hypothetical protein [Gammaproteobacteria bacterium]